MGVSNSQPSGQQVGSPIMCLYRGTAEVPRGAAICYDFDASTAADRDRLVEQCTYANFNHFAGVVNKRVPADSSGSDRYIEVIPPDRIVPGLEIYSDENCAVEDVLGPIPGTFAFGKAAMGNPCFIVTTAADRSSTAGTVTGRWGPVNQDILRRKYYDFLEDFDGRPNIFLGGATPAEIAVPGMILSGATVAGAWTNDVGGRLAMTPTTTTIAQLNVGAVAAGTASGMACLPYTNAAGRNCFLRGRVNFGVGAVDSAVFFGWSITGAVVSNAAVPATDDYLGLFRKVDDDGSLFVATNRDNGTDNLTDTGVNSSVDGVFEFAMLVRNRVSGDALNACVVQAGIDGALVATLSSAAQNALMNKDEAMGLVFAGIDGAAAVVIEVDRIEARFNR